MGAGAGAGISGGLGQSGSQTATPSQDGGQSAAPTGTFTGSMPSFMQNPIQNAMQNMMAAQQNTASQMGSQAPSQTSSWLTAKPEQRGTIMSDGSEVFPDGRVYAGPMAGTPAHSSAPPPGFEPQQSRSALGLGGLGTMLRGFDSGGGYGGGFGGGFSDGFGAGRFNPVMGGRGRYFSPVDQGPPQSFGINRTTPLQYQAASYPQGNLANQLASGYQQVFGRAADPTGMDYWINKLGGRDMSQGEVNRYLLGGAAGTDVGAGSDYAMSLTGGRPSLYDTSKPLTDSAGKPILDSSGKPQYEYTRQYNQPIYQPTYTNYAMNRGFYSPGYGMGLGGGFSGGGPYGAFGGGYGSGFGGYGGGFNPFSYAEGGNVYADDNNEEDQGIAALLNR